MARNDPRIPSKLTVWVRFPSLAPSFRQFMEVIIGTVVEDHRFGSNFAREMLGIMVVTDLDHGHTHSDPHTGRPGPRHDAATRRSPGTFRAPLTGSTDLLADDE